MDLATETTAAQPPPALEQPEPAPEALRPDWLTGIAQRTLRGDLRDALLGQLRDGHLRAKCWDDLGEDEQRQVASRLEDAVTNAIGIVVELARTLEAPFIKADFAECKLTGKGVTMKIVAGCDPDNLLRASELVDTHVYVISASRLALMGETRPVQINREQRELPIDDEAQADMLDGGNGPDMGAVNEAVNGEARPQDEAAESIPPSVAIPARSKVTRGRGPLN